MMERRPGKVVATIEARMRSTRLPGKVMREACGRPLLALMVERVRRARTVDEVVVATTADAADDPIAALAGRLKVSVHRGPEQDVLRRVHDAAVSAGAGVIVELTGDCPLIDPALIDAAVEQFFAQPCDYVSNCRVPGLPLGMAVEVFSLELLQVADREGRRPEDREHVSWFFIRQPERFRLVDVPVRPQHHAPDLRLTVDEEPDYRLVRMVFETLYPQKTDFDCADIVDLLRRRPELAAINAHVQQRVI